MLDVFLDFLPHDKILDWSKLKAYADNKIYVTQKLIFTLGRVETLWEKHFLLFLIMFSKGFFLGVVKSLDCVEKELNDIFYEKKKLYKKVFASFLSCY